VTLRWETARPFLLALAALACAACGDSAASQARGDVRAVRATSSIREHVDLSVFPDRPGTRACAIHVGGGARALGMPGRRIPATCSTSVRDDGDRVVVFTTHWKQFHEQGFFACSGSGVAGSCLESPSSTKATRIDAGSYTWEFRIDSERHIIGTRVHGAFPPWWAGISTQA
jgi:hypothetical protein